MTIYIIRHGETLANKEKRFAGITDVPLTPFGEEQAKQVGIKLKDVSLEAIYCSDLSRAHQTATHIQSHHQVPLTTDARFREMNFGMWEGLTFEEIKRNHANELDQWFKNFATYVVPEGESVSHVYNRVSLAYEGLLSEHGKDSKKNIAIVAHGGVIQALLSYILYGNIDGYWRFGIDNCGLTKIEYVMGMPVLKSLNQ